MPHRLIALLVMLVPMGAAADRIVFRDGRTVEGRVVSETETRIAVEANGMRLEFSRAAIANVVRDAPWTNALLQAEGALRGGGAARGMDALLKALGQGAAREDVSRLMDQYHSQISSTIRGSTVPRRSEIGFALHRLVAAEALTTPTMFRASQHFYQLEDYNAAAEALTPLTVDDLQADPLKRTYALELMRFLVRRQLRRGEFENALQWLETMRRIAGDEVSGSLALAALSSAATAREQGRFDTAILILTRDLYPHYPEIARNRLAQTVDVMKATIDESRNYAAAIAALGPLAQAFPIQHASAINHFMALEARRALDNGEPLRAIELVETIDEQIRSAELDALHDRAHHDHRLEEIGEGDPLALMDLGQWCADRGMLDQAIAIFDRTRRNPNLRDLSGELLRTLRRERDTELLEEAQEAYDLGDFGEVLRTTIAIIESPGVESALEKEAIKLRDLANASMRRDREAQPYRAEVLFQNAERAYFANNLEEAYSLLKVIIQAFPDTPAGGRARELLPAVMRSIELAFLEGRRLRLPQVDFSQDQRSLQRIDRLDEEVSELLEALDEKL